MTDPARTPVIVGVGQINDRPKDPAEGLDSYGLMLAAAHRADEDAGGGWLEGLQSIVAVDQISFAALGDVSPRLAEAFGAHPRHCYKTKYPMGTSPVRLLNEAANRIAAGEITSALITGGEALRTAAQRAAASAGGKASDHNVMRDIARRATPNYKQRYGLAAPVDVYPLYENATRAAWKQTLALAQRESAEIWSLMSETAAQNPHAWIRTRHDAAAIATRSPENRPIAFPYTKLMVANSSVNQGAAFIVTSLAEARARGNPEDRLIYVGYGAAADETTDILERDRYDRSASLEASLLCALEANAITPGELDCVELYSCFPCMPKMARRVIDWPLERSVTVFGGLTFGGGPIGNYMSHAIASMTQLLRREGRHGLLYGNGGYATQSHCIILSRDPAKAMREARDFDVQAIAESRRCAPPPLNPDYRGPATIETYTLFYDRQGAVTSGVIVARTADGARFLAKVLADDMEVIGALSDGKSEAVGCAGIAVQSGEDTLWRIA